ncbi:MAG: YitT family protein [Oscillospiraceae bacterium]|nr:YitT family protein [Oscillospiraceae bacterium]
MKQHMTLWDYVSSVFRILIGTFMAAAAFSFLQYPNSIPTGGITGIAQILNMLIGTPVGMVAIAMNVPLFLLAGRKLGTVFMLGSLLAMLCENSFIDLLALCHVELTPDPLLASVYAGVIYGAGWGIVYTTGVCGGGIDIPAKLVKLRRPYMNFGTVLLILNVSVMVAFALIFKKYDRCMYAMITMYISSKVMDMISYGPMDDRLCFVVSDKSQEITLSIYERLERGVTFLQGKGAWSRERKDVILCVVKRSQAVELRHLIRDIDPEAFFVITDARGVYGNGFTDIDHEDF